MFITFEGGEGTGKSTQAKILAARLRSGGREVVETREPGGTPEAEALRQLLLNGRPESWSATSEALLMYAARDCHLRQLIRPNLAQGKTVVCDRFMDSTRAYQGYAGGVSLDFISELQRAIVGETLPNLTLVFDLDPEIGLARAKERGSADRFERKSLEFHRQLRQGFLEIARLEPHRCKVIDAGATMDIVSEEVWKIVHG